MTEYHIPRDFCQSEVLAEGHRAGSLTALAVQVQFHRPLSSRQHPVSNGKLPKSTLFDSIRHIVADKIFSCHSDMV